MRRLDNRQAHLSLVNAIRGIPSREVNNTPPINRWHDFLARGLFGTRVLRERIPHALAEQEVADCLDGLMYAARKLQHFPCTVFIHSPLSASIDFGGARVTTVQCVPHGVSGYGAIVVELEKR